MLGWSSDFRAVDDLPRAHWDETELSCPFLYFLKFLLKTYTWGSQTELPHSRTGRTSSLYADDLTSCGHADNTSKEANGPISLETVILPYLYIIVCVCVCVFCCCCFCFLFFSFLLLFCLVVVVFFVVFFVCFFFVFFFCFFVFFFFMFFCCCCFLVCLFFLFFVCLFVFFFVILFVSFLFVSFFSLLVCCCCFFVFCCFFFFRFYRHCALHWNLIHLNFITTSPCDVCIS